MNFGYTNDEQALREVLTWMAAAIADGWEATPTYPNQEPMDSACTLKREGFVAHVLARTKDVGKWRFQAKVDVWAPDTLSIALPGPVYDWPAIRARLRHCNYCDADDVDTERVSFAGRCCAQCLPTQRQIRERPGWCD